MLVMAVLLLAGTTFMTISSTERQIAINEQVWMQAVNLAEAGLHRAMAKLNNPTTYPSYAGETNTALGSGTFTVIVTTPATQPCSGGTAREVVSIGRVPKKLVSASAATRATITPPTSMPSVGSEFRNG